MKKVLMTLLAGCLCVTFLAAQDIDGKVLSAVNNLAARINVPLEVNIYPVTLAGTDTSTGLSRYLAGKINHHVVNNAKFNVVPVSRGLKSPGAPRRGIITGTFNVVGDNVEVFLEMISDTNGAILASESFYIPAAELKQMGINLLPDNFDTAAEVREQEKILEPVPVSQPVQSTPPPASAAGPASGLIVEVWPDNDTNTYFDGDELKVGLWASQNCYVKVYHISIDDEIQLIFPNTLNRNNFLSAGTERYVPEAPQRFSLHKPFGQETIVVLASTEQFVNVEAEFGQKRQATAETVRGLTRGGSLVSSAGPPSAGGSLVSSSAETVSTRCSFTILPATFFDEVYSFKKPDDMNDAIQSLRDDVLSQGGSFSGNEREGLFSVDGTEGYYSVTGDTVTFGLRYTGNQVAGRTVSRSAGNAAHNFTIDKPRNISQAVQSVRSGIEGKGGSFTGNEQQGAFRASGIAGRYNVGDQVSVSISEKPKLIPNSLIEKEVRSYFSGK